MRLLTREELLPLDKVTLVEIILKQQEQIPTLTKRVGELEASLHKTSRNSSKPPSTDGLAKPPPKPKSLRKKSTRKSGGQPKHKGHTLELTDAPDHTIEIPVTQCDGCDAQLSDQPVMGHERRQVFEIPQPRIEITEYRSEMKSCPECGKNVKGVFPDGVNARTQYGERFNAVLVYLNQQMLLPAERTVQLIKDLFGQQVSQGTLFRAVEKCHDKLAGYEDAIKQMLQQALVAHADESGARVAGSLHWLHVVCTQMLTFYGIHKQRGRDAMEALEVLPKFVGRLIHDHWKTYFSFDCLHGLCNAHHLRELLFLFEEEKQQWAGDMMKVLLDMNDFVKLRRYEGASELTQDEKMHCLVLYHAVIRRGKDANPFTEPIKKKRGPSKRTKAQNLLRRLEDFEVSVLAFLHDFNVPFTNNLAEQDIRMLKVRLKASGCFRTLGGAEKFARIRGYLSTARKNSVNPLDAITRAYQGKPFIPNL